MMHVCCTGIIAKAKLTKTSRGQSVLNISMRLDGANADSGLVWVSVAIWESGDGFDLDGFARSLQKGAHIGASGILKIDLWVSKDGEMKTSGTVTARSRRDIVKLDAPRQNWQGQRQQMRKP